MPRISNNFKLKLFKTWFHFGGAITPRLVAMVAYGAFFTRPFRHKPLPADVELINQAEILKIQFENRYLRGYSWGSGAKTILFAHGWSSHALTMRQYIKALIKHGYKVVAFDAPAHGNSEGKRTNAIQYRHLLHYLIDKYQPYAIVAHSLGGICTLTELASISEFKVAKVITLAIPVTSKLIVRRFLEEAKLHRMTHRHFERHVERRMGINHAHFDLECIFPNGIPYTGLIVHDINDSIISYTEAVKLAKLWPQATMITTRGLDHSGVLKDKQLVEQVVKYILD